MTSFSFSRVPLLAAIAASLAIGACSNGTSDGPGPGSLHAVLPSVALTGVPLPLHVVPITDIGTPETEWRGTLTVASTDSSFSPGREFRATGEGGLVKEGLVFRTPGFQRITVVSSDGREAIAGPVRVVESEEELRWRRGDPALRLWWGDVHGHSTIGDGAHPPDHYFYYAREVARLDFTCLSEHDFQQFLEVGYDETAGSWQAVAETAAKWRAPGFAVLLGWEWSSRRHGHRVVLFPDDSSRYISYREAESPTALAEALRGSGAFSILAHPRGSRLTPAIDWSGVVPGFDRAVEIYSGHGGMAEDPAFRPTSEPREDASALEGFRRGHRLALVGTSDTHLSTPGNPTPPAIRDAPWRGGLTAVWAPSATEPEIFAAIRDGRCYATSGERFLVDLHCRGKSLGETVDLPPGKKELPIRGFVAAPALLSWVDVMIDDTAARRLNCRGLRQAHFDIFAGPFDGDGALWLRGESESGERFWTTPIWVDAGGDPRSSGSR